MTTWHIISPKFPPLRGGIGFHTAHLGGGLVSKGNTVHVWTTSTSDDEKHQNIVKKIDEVVFASKHTMNTKSSRQKKLSVHRIITQFTDESLYQIEQQISEIGGTLLHNIVLNLSDHSGLMLSQTFTKNCQKRLIAEF